MLGKLKKYFAIIEAQVIKVPHDRSRTKDAFSTIRMKLLNDKIIKESMHDLQGVPKTPKTIENDLLLTFACTSTC